MRGGHIYRNYCKFSGTEIYSGLPSFLELRCSGGAGESRGDEMGVYQLLHGGGEKGNQGQRLQLKGLMTGMMTGAPT